MTHHSDEASDADGLQLDVDGDGIADVLVPGLGASPSPTSFGVSDTSSYLNLDESRLPPTSSPLSPMGRIEHQGYALHNVMSRPSWRRTLIKAGFWAFFALLALTIAASVIKNGTP